MIFVILPGAFSLLSICILIATEIRNYRIFKQMPRIRMEKREELWVSMLPFLASAQTKNKIMAEQMGWEISGIFMGYIRLMILLTSFTIGGLIIFTNNAVIRSEIIGNMNIGKTFIELQNSHKPSAEMIKAEANKIRILESQIPAMTIKRGGAELESSVQGMGGQWNIVGREGQNVEDKRLAQKLTKLYKLKYAKEPWIQLLLVSLLLYLLPIPLGWIKRSIRGQKKREEIIRLYETMLLYGELPPYEIKTLMANMLHRAVLYKETLSKVMEGIKAGYCEKVLEEVIKVTQKEKDWSFADLLEHLKIFYLTGILSKDKDLERIINRKTKMEEIYMEKKRESKIQLAAVPLGIIISLGTWYFMLGTMSLSNMSILGH